MDTEKTEYIKVYELGHKRLGSRIIYDNPKDALEEIKTHLEEGGEIGDYLHLAIYEMKKEHYENLSEFQGW